MYWHMDLSSISAKLKFKSWCKSNSTWLEKIWEFWCKINEASASPQRIHLGSYNRRFQNQEIFRSYSKPISKPQGASKLCLSQTLRKSLILLSITELRGQTTETLDISDVSLDYKNLAFGIKAYLISS